MILPPEKWSCGATAAGLLLALVVAGLCQVGFASAKRAMIETGGVGIVGFEKIRSWEKADPLVARWRESRRGWQAARRSLAVDSVFVVAYGLGLYLLAAVVARHARGLGHTGWAEVAALAGVAFVIAAVLDTIENIALLRILYLKHGPNWPLLAYLCSQAKFYLLAVGGLVLVTVSVTFIGQPPRAVRATHRVPG